MFGETTNDTGVKSRTGSKGMVRKRLTLTACVLTPPITSVYPSGAALATYSQPMLPLAPGLFSTTTGWFIALARPVATRRANASAYPPAA